jgi:hypothetical protein
VAIAKAGPNEYLLVGRGGRLENRGSAVQTFLRPGTITVLVPSSKQEAAFEFTQETNDGVPLRFKGIVLYRVTDPIAAARQFDFGSPGAVERITTLLTHVCLGELRHAVSHMTMVECIEGRKTTLSGVAAAALAATVGTAHADPSDPGGWGITVEVAQVAQVFIVDAELRRQLEAEVRNEIKLKSDQSDVRTREEAERATLASEDRVAEQKLALDRERLRRDEELIVARVARDRRMGAEDLATEQHALELERERFRARAELDRDRLETETPVRLQALVAEAEVLRQELETRRLRTEVKGVEVEAEMALPRARLALRREILPIEQAPRIVEAASKVLNGTTLSLYGQDAQLVGQLAPLLDVIGRAVAGATNDTGPRRTGTATGSATAGDA